MTYESPFSAFRSALRGVLCDESAQTLVEYAIIIALVAMVAMVTIRTLGRRVTNSLSSATNGFS